MTVFALLFKFWPIFCEFRKNLGDESQILPVLEKQREKKKLEKLKIKLPEKEAEEKVRKI